MKRVIPSLVFYNWALDYIAVYEYQHDDDFLDRMGYIFIGVL